MLSIVQKLIAGFATLIIGILLITTIATTTNSNTSVITVGSETLDISAARLGGSLAINESQPLYIENYPTADASLWKLSTDVSECNVSANTVTLANQSRTAKTISTDFTVANAGIIYLKNSATMNNSVSNTTYVGYQYCPDGYLSTSFGRTGIQLIPGFFALALLLVSVGLFYSVAKESNLI